MARISLFSGLVFFLGFFQLLVYAAPASQDAQLSIGDIINALGLGFVDQINTIISLESLETNIVEVNFEASNPLIIELTFDRIVSTAGVNGTVYATFDHTFKRPGFVVPLLGTANSGRIPNVFLPQGVEGSLEIIPLGKLDLISVDAFVRTATIKGFLGIPLTIRGLKQADVPTNYTIVA